MTDPKDNENQMIGSALNFVNASGSTFVQLFAPPSDEFILYRCPHCKHAVGKNQKKCHNCGTELQA